MDMGDQDHRPHLRRRPRGAQHFKPNVHPKSRHQKSFASHITSNVSGLTSTITSNLTSNLTGRSQNFNLVQHANTGGPARRTSADFKIETNALKNMGSRPLTMNHLLRGKTALTTKTKRVVARGLVVVPPAPKKKVSKPFACLSPQK